MKDAISVLLLHLGVNVEAGITEFRDFLSEQLDPLGGVAKDNGLVDLQLGEQGVETMHLLALLDEGVILRHSLQR